MSLKDMNHHIVHCEKTHFSLMELDHNDQLQILIAKTWDLHSRINQGRYCVVSNSTVEEREKMIPIRDSLTELHNILVYLQRLRSSQENRRNEALARLEECRRNLMERINQCPEKERKLDVLEEVVTIIGEGKCDEFRWKKMDEKIEQKNLNGISRFVIQSSRFALEFVVMFACIYASTAKLCKSRQQKQVMDSRMISGKPEFLLTGSDNIRLDVLCGRG